MQQLDSSIFDWQTWRAGSPKDLGLTCRESMLTSSRGSSIIREHAIGWCDAKELYCRPKENNMAVMFLKDNKYFWFHLTYKEFYKIFY